MKAHQYLLSPPAESLKEKCERRNIVVHITLCLKPELCCFLTTGCARNRHTEPMSHFWSQCHCQGRMGMMIEAVDATVLIQCTQHAKQGLNSRAPCSSFMPTQQVLKQHSPTQLTDSCVRYLQISIAASAVCSPLLVHALASTAWTRVAQTISGVDVCPFAKASSRAVSTAASTHVSQ